MLSFIVFGLVVLALLWLPVMLVRGAFRLFFGLVFLPLKLVGGIIKVIFGIFGAVFGVLGGLFRVLLSGVGLVAGLVAFVFFVLLLPLLPILLFVGGVWLLTRRSRRPATIRAIA
jgi:hypothetical protein